MYFTDNEDSSGISTETIVGIVIGGVAMLIIVVIIIVAISCSVAYKKERKF